MALLGWRGFAGGRRGIFCGFADASGKLAWEKLVKGLKFVLLGVSVSVDTTATLRIGSENYHLPLLEGTEKERAVDISRLRAQSKTITFDEGYGNTGSCESKITFIDGEKGILRYRGYPIEQLAKNASYLEVAYLLIYGELPNAEIFEKFSAKILKATPLGSNWQESVESFPKNGHPMGMLGALSNMLACQETELASNDKDKILEHFDTIACFLLAHLRELAAMSYRFKQGLDFNSSDLKLDYSSNFLHMLFSESGSRYAAEPAIAKALDLIFILHADHEQNCSTSTVRMVASSGVNAFAAVSSGIAALWGPLHGGANMAVLKMLENIQASGDDGNRFVEEAKDGKQRLVGFGHRVYKNHDPRAKILGEAAESVLAALKVKDPLLDIARCLEQKALEQDYFIERKLYPNVDFYSGIILRAIGIPLDMFTVIFALGRLSGWLAHYGEIAMGPLKIHRPRQVYQGAVLRDYVPIQER